MARIIAIANQKGGVGKTTTAVNLAASLAIAERRTLLLDADPQGNATSGVGIVKGEVSLSLYDVMIDHVELDRVVVRRQLLPHLDILPATQDLVGAELELVDKPGRETALRDALRDADGSYDYILVDCPPSLGLLTLNVLAAAQGVIIPIQCEYYALEGISQLLNTVRLVQQNFNPALAIDGVLLTMYDSRLNLCRQVAEDAKEYFGAQVFRTPIPRNVRLAEAPSFGQPILLYDVQSVGARSYLAVGQELIRRIEQPESLSFADAVTQEMPAAAVTEAAVPAPADVAGKAPAEDAFTPDDAPLDDLMVDAGLGDMRAESARAAPQSRESSREKTGTVSDEDTESGEDDADIAASDERDAGDAEADAEDPVAADTMLAESLADGTVDDPASAVDTDTDDASIRGSSADPERPVRERSDATGDDSTAGDIEENAESAEVKP